jgi:hypothetical protein
MPKKPTSLEIVEKKSAEALPSEIKNELFTNPDGSPKSREEISLIWQSRRGRMERRRSYFEPLWRNGITSFFQGIIGEAANASRPLYNQLYEQYDFSVFSRDGMRFSQIKYPMLHAIVFRALAAEIQNLPKVNFVAVGSNDTTKTMAFKHLFDQVLYEMNADSENLDILLDRKVFGSSIAMAMTDTRKVTVKDPVGSKDGEIAYRKKTKTIKQCLYKKLDLRHVLLDEHCVRSDLSDNNYSIVDEYLAPQDFMRVLGQYPDAAEACKTIQEKEDGSSYYNWYDPKGVGFVRVEHCFDRIQDCYHIKAGGKILNDPENPIPRIAGRRGKDIPIVLASQYKIPGSPYGYGDSHVVSNFNFIKNLVRMMILEITQKTAKGGILAIDPLSSFDEQQFEWGQDFVRVAPNELKQIPVNADMESLYKLDETVDEDVIRSTGININDTSNSDANETARKTVIRRESQNSLIELGLTNLTNSFFKPLYTLLKDDIRLYYKSQLANGEVVKVMSKDVRLTPDGTGYKAESVAGFRYFDLREQDLDFDMELDLEMGNIATSRELEKALQQEALQYIIPLLGTGAFDAKGVAQWLKDLNYMPDGVLPQANGQGSGGKTAEQAATEGIDQSLLPLAAQMRLNPNNPNGIAAKERRANGG